MTLHFRANLRLSQMLRCFLLSVAWIPSALAQQLLLLDIQVAGNARLSSAAVISTTGLKAGQTVTTKDFDAAMARLDETGLFTSLAYRYDPKASGGQSGFALVVQVTEAPAVSGVRLDIPGVDSEQLWQEIKSHNGLIDAQIPASQDAVQYYEAAVKAALQRLNQVQEIVAKNEVDLKTGKRMVAIQGANLPKIVGIAFEGNRAIDSRTLAATLEHAAFLGEGYSESYVRVLLDVNVKPVYEERGRLTVAFPRVGMTPTASGVTVSAAVEEGAEWTLGKVELMGEGVPVEEMHAAAKFPEGRLANWKQIEAGIEDAKAVLKRDGYLGVAFQTTRTYHDENHLIDLTEKVVKGKQYTFGAMELSGLMPAEESQARKMWQLAEGAPMNPFYVDDYLRRLGKEFKGIKSLSRGLRPRAGTQVMDVVIKITMR
jgi:outer membrane protein assembly factor BamA